MGGRHLWKALGSPFGLSKRGSKSQLGCVEGNQGWDFLVVATPLDLNLKKTLIRYKNHLLRINTFTLQVPKQWDGIYWERTTNSRIHKLSYLSHGRPWDLVCPAALLHMRGLRVVSGHFFILFLSINLNLISCQITRNWKEHQSKGVRGNWSTNLCIEEVEKKIKFSLHNNWPFGKGERRRIRQRKWR